MDPDTFTCKALSPDSGQAGTAQHSLIVFSDTLPAKEVLAFGAAHNRLTTAVVIAALLAKRLAMALSV